MTIDVSQLSNAAAVEALSIVARSWIQHKGLEVYKVYYGVRSIIVEQFQGLPTWASDIPEVTDASGEFARKMLMVLNDAEDDEVQAWTRQSFERLDTATAHVDPVTLGIGGIILIGAILAARVRKIGPVEFYKDIPDDLANVLKAGTTIPL